jgi:hypothetical protein
MKKKWFLPIMLLLVFTVFISSETIISQPAGSALEEELQKLRESGIPTTIEELNLPDIPDAENARFLYEEAGKLQRSLFEKHRELWNYFPLSGSVPWDEVPSDEKERVTDYIINDPEFSSLCSLLGKAINMKCRFFDMKTYLQHFESGIGNDIPSISANMRRFARTLADKAKVESEYGDINIALNTALTGLKLGESFSNDPFFIILLVRLAIENIALKDLQDVIENISFRHNEGQKQDMGIYQEILTQLHTEKIPLKNQLIASNIIDARLRFAYFKNLGEKMFELSEQEKKIIEMFKSHHEGGGSRITTSESIEKSYRESKELLKKDFMSSEMERVEDFLAQQEVLYLSIMNRIIPLMQKPYYETIDELNKVFEETEKEVKGKYTLLYISNPLVMKKIFLQYLRYKAYMETSEIGIANVVFKQQKGRYIDKISEFTPEILPALPLDPFTGKDYIYRKKEKGFIVYSVADNLKDDGGIPQFSEEGRKSGNFDIVWEDKD